MEDDHDMLKEMYFINRNFYVSWAVLSQYRALHFASFVSSFYMITAYVMEVVVENYCI